MARIRIPLFLLATLVLGACATTTPYQPLKNGQGYSEQKIESNRYRIMFAGSASTSHRTVETYLLYRAAELTLQNGFDYFLLSGSIDQRTARAASVGVGFGGFSIGSSGGVGFGIGAASGTGDAPIERADVVMFRGAKPADNPIAYDAHQIKANLEGEIKRPKQG